MENIWSRDTMLYVRIIPHWSSRKLIFLKASPEQLKLTEAKLAEES